MSAIITCTDCGNERPHAGHGRCRTCASRNRRASLQNFTRHGYTSYCDGCRCEVCRKAKAGYTRQRRRNALLNTDPDPVPGITHGRFGYEERGCRCDVCVGARREMWRKVDRRRRGRAA